MIEEKIRLEKELRFLKESLESYIISEEEYKKRKGIIEKKLISLEEASKEEKKSKKAEKEGRKEKKEKNIKYKHTLIPLLIILFAMSLSVYLRVQTAYLPATDDWATESVHNSLKSPIINQVNQQYFNLPEANRDALVDAEFQKVLEQQKSQIEQQIKQTSAFFKSRLQNDNGQTYLLAVDPYFWMRKAKNIIDHGYPGDLIKKKGEINPDKKTIFKKDTEWNSYTIAPNGRPSTPDVFHAYFEAYLYKFISVFNRDIELMKVAFYVPVIISALAVIPAFFIARRFGGNFAGFIAAVFIAIHTAFLNRTAGGFSDTDAYNVFFPLFILWLYFVSLDSKSRVKSIALVASSGLLVGLYSFTWNGWWYIFDFIIAASIIYLIYFFLTDIKEIKTGFIKFVSKPEIKNVLIVMLIFIISSALFVTLFRDSYALEDSWRAPLGFSQLKEVGISEIWPNVFTSVSEQSEASLDLIILDIGGKFLFFISLIGILSIFVIFWKDSNKKSDIKIAILLIIWFFSTIYASTKGVRWVLLLVPAFSIAFGIALGKIYQYLSRIAIKELNINKIVAKSIIIILLCLLLVGPWNSAKSAAEQKTPGMNDAWWNSLEKIKLESEPNAIINSWWDFGHWFKAIADRPVTFDGISQNSPQAHWIGNVLLTNDEDTAIGILRMLDCDVNHAFNAVDKIIKDGAYTIDILYEVIAKDRNEAKKILLNHNLTEEQADFILAKTHCEPPEDYFIVSEDMIRKSDFWAHFGSWDFNKAQIYSTLNKKEYRDNKEASINYLKERFEYDKEKADNIYYEIKSLTSNDDVDNWIAPWPSYGGSSSCEKQDEFNLICSNGVQVDLKNNEIFAIDQNQKKMYPRSFAIPAKDGNLVIKEYNESLLRTNKGEPASAVLVPEGESYNLLIMDYALTGSMFTRLFYLNGSGLKHFKKFSDERSVFGGRIITYKVDWDGNKENIIEMKESVSEEESKKPNIKKENNLN